MLQQFMPPGPAAGQTPAPIVDRTQLLSPADYWPNAIDCPDWPQLGPNQGFDGQRGKAGAEARLIAIAFHLNRGAGQVQAPTPQDREAVIGRTFSRGPTRNASWQALGIRDLNPLGMMAEDDAKLIVEACHIRGYLRKLEVKAERDAEAAKRQKEAEARRTIEEYRTKGRAAIEEISALAEAAARHQQRVEDEQAFHRTFNLRQHVDTLHSAAVQAAHTLGLSVPDAPEF